MTGAHGHDRNGRPNRTDQPRRPSPQDRPNGAGSPSAPAGPDQPEATGPGTRQERREQTRDALLRAAQRLWAERGIHRGSLDEIAAAAGLTKGAVYSNFTGKTDLVLALLDRHTQARLNTEVCAELHDPDRPMAERLERAGQAYARRAGTEDARLLALLLVEFWLYGMRDYAAGWRLAEWYDARRREIALELTDTEGISAADRATLTMALDFGLMLQHLLDPERIQADELYSTGLRLVLAPALR